MNKLYNEFFDELERVLIPAAIMAFSYMLTSWVWSMSIDLSQLSKDNFIEKLNQLFEEKKLLIMLNMVFSFLINLYSLMGLWYCLLKKGKSSFLDFFKGGMTLFFNGFFPYLLINIYPVIVFLFALLYGRLLEHRFLYSFLIFMAIIISLWIGARISMWQGFAASGKKFISPMYESFISTRGMAYILFWILIFPYFFFSNIGYSVTWKFLIYFFMIFNSAMLPVVIEIIRYMLFSRIVLKKTTV